jgi:elongation factor G
MEGALPVKSYPTDHVRNVLVVGHSGAGKTTLVESLLYATGAVSRTGRVEDGTTVTDYEPEEARKGISVSLALAPVEHEGFKINLLDAPGFPDFLGEVRSALQAVDAVLFVVSAVDGVETQTEVVWSMASERGLPCAFFVNKLDRDRASFERTLAQIKDTFAQTIEPVYLPIGEAATFTGLVGLLSGMAFDYTDGKRSEAPVPDALAGEVETLRGQLIEAIIQEAENEALMDRYLEGEELEPSDLIEDLKVAIGAGKLVPVLAGSALTGVGTTELLEVLTTGFASPATSAPWPGTVPGTGAEVTPSADRHGPLAAYVFKTISDPYVGRLSMFRVVSGTFRGDTTVTNATTGKDERAAHLLTMRGKNQESLGELAAGDIGAVAKLTETSTGDTLCDKSDPVALASPSMPEPLLPVAVQPKSKGDEEKLSSGLARAEAEDLTLRVTRNTETRQTVLWGLGETHVELTLERLKRRYGVEVTTVGLRLPYKETFKKAVKAKGRHVKQSGGHGQYGICDIEVEPLPRGQGFEFVDKIYGGAVPHQFIPSVEKGVRKAMDDGLLAGYPVEDVRVTLYDGKYHSVDSSDMAFQVAGSLAMKEAAAAGDMALLEPILEVAVLIPDDYVGDVLGDLSSRRGRVVGTEPVGVGRTLVRATVPESEFTRYAIDLRSMTRGRGSFSRSFSHYEDLPANMAAKVVEQAQAEE